MDRALNPRNEKQTIYEIYRACRLCGAGAGYKMPIIQNVVDLDDQDVQLKQKIRECVQIEVHHDDKMPPLICELCVDKVNDFYEFLEMCRQTNIRTRLRLGLPPQSMPRGAPDAGDCILGVTEPVYVNSDSDGEPLVKHKETTKQKRPNPTHKTKLKKETEVRIKVETYVPPKLESRTTRQKVKREPTPPRVTRHSLSSKSSDDSLLNKSQDSVRSTKSMKSGPKSILKKIEKTENTSLLTPRLKRPREKENLKADTSIKKVKITISSPPRRAVPPRPLPSPSPSPSPSPTTTASPPRLYICDICQQQVKTSQGKASHMRLHTVGFTASKLACNACGEWFLSHEQALAHHKRHKSKGKPYHCKRCTADFKHQLAYDVHFANNQCIPWESLPDEKCEECWHKFPTRKLLDDHLCPGEVGRPGGKCTNCNKTYALLRNLKKHQTTCTAKRKGELIVDPELLGRLKPIQVRVARCDPLLTRIKKEHIDVSSVATDFGLDRNCIYPYISSVSSLHIKSEPEDYDNMVSIKQEIKEEFCTEEDYVHWDSASSDSDSDSHMVVNPFAKRKRIDSLASLSLKTIFSQRFLGKVPKRRRKVKTESGFDSLMATNDDDVRRDIDKIINNLGTNDEGNDREGDESPDIFNLSKNGDGNWSGNDYLNFGANITTRNDGNDVSNQNEEEKTRDGVRNDEDKNTSDDNDGDTSKNEDDTTRDVVREDRHRDSDVKVVDNDDSLKLTSDVSVNHVDIIENNSVDLTEAVVNDPNKLKGNVSDSLNDDSNNSRKGNELSEVDDIRLSSGDSTKHNSNTSSIIEEYAENGDLNNLIKNSVKIDDTSDANNADIGQGKNTSDLTKNIDKKYDLVEVSRDIERKENGHVSVCKNDDSNSSPGNDKVNNMNRQIDVSLGIDGKLNDCNSSLAAVECNDNNDNTTVNDNANDGKCSVKVNNCVNNDGLVTDVPNSDLNAKLSFNIDKTDSTRVTNSNGSLKNSVIDDVISGHNEISNANAKNDHANANKEHANVINSVSNHNSYDSALSLAINNEVTNNNCKNDKINLNRDKITDFPIVNTQNLSNTIAETSSNANPSAITDHYKDIIDKTSTEEEDRILMEEIDAQIGENDKYNDNAKLNDNNRANDKILLEDLIESKNIDHSLDLDNISDEDFNFDN